MILNAIRERSAISRVELSRASELSIATTKRLIDELIAAGMVREAEVEESRHRGRKASLLRLDEKHGYAIGVNVEPRSLRLAGIDFPGAMFRHRELDLPTEDQGCLLARVVEEIRRLAAECSREQRGPLLGIGVGIAGLVNAREGVVLYCPGLPGWENVPLAATLREAFAVDAMVDDVVRCMTLAEKRYGSAKDLDTFLFVYIGSGVGAGIVLENRIYRGTHGASGEFGHITIKETGPRCKCGNQGCLEALASTGGVQARLQSFLSAGVYSTISAGSFPTPLAEIYRAARAGDKLATMVIAETEENIGIGIANLINVFDPSTVILAGEVIANFHELILDGIRRTVQRRAMPSIAHRTSIVASTRQGDLTPRGAATMVIERELSNAILNL